MTYNEFKLCYILLIKKYEGKLWGEVFPSCYTCDKSNVVTIKNFTLLNCELIFGTCVLCRCSDFHIYIYREGGVGKTMTVNNFIKYFKIPFEDFV